MFNTGSEAGFTNCMSTFNNESKINQSLHVQDTEKEGCLTDTMQMNEPKSVVSPFETCKQLI